MAIHSADDSRRKLVDEASISTHDAGGESDKTGVQVAPNPLHESATAVGSVHAGQPFLHFYNETNSPSQFKLHASNPCSSFEAYGTTLTLVIMLHLIYLYQWNRRRSRSDVCTNYDQLVNKRQYYRAVIAICSHPPVDHTGSRSDGINIDEPSGVNAEASVESSGFRGRLRGLFAFLRRVSRPLVYGSLSGLPLLTYASHIIWQARALEELYDEHDGSLMISVHGDVDVRQLSTVGTARMLTDPVARNIETTTHGTIEGCTYFRVLVVLVSVSLAMELTVLRGAFSIAQRHIDFRGTDGFHELLSQRAICSTSSLAAALVKVYSNHFSDAPLPLFPFVGLSTPAFNSVSFLLVLWLLSRRIHPFASILSGLFSGTLWSMGITTFLSCRYWGNALFFVLGLGVLMSFKAHPTMSIYVGTLVPCLDYVSWDGVGKMKDERTAVHSYPRTARGDGDDVESGTGPSGSSPLVHSESSEGFNVRGRIPSRALESDLIDDANTSSMDQTTQRFGSSLSRRVVD